MLEAVFLTSHMHIFKLVENTKKLGIINNNIKISVCLNDTFFGTFKRQRFSKTVISFFLMCKKIILILFSNRLTTLGKNVAECPKNINVPYIYKFFHHFIGIDFFHSF